MISSVPIGSDWVRAELHSTNISILILDMFNVPISSQRHVRAESSNSTTFEHSNVYSTSYVIVQMSCVVFHILKMYVWNVE